MAYLAFYRTFRPTTFSDVVRQEHIVRILTNQIKSDKVGHAYLFCGPRGTGKTTLAKIFARAINCENPVDGSPCGKCSVCKALSENGNLDISEIDAASNNGVDEMRDLREKVQYPPVAGKYKVYIIDEVHMLTPSAFNAVLKTLEEPPRHAVFILATTEPQKIPATILSRCMRFDFKLIPQSDLENLIKSVFIKTGKEFDEQAVSAIARAGAGSARDSLSIADMCASYSRGKLTYEDVNAVLGSTEYAKVADICRFILEEDSAEAISATEAVLSTGKSVGVLIKDILSFLNDLTIVKVCKNSREIINLPDESYKRIEDVASWTDGHKILRVTEIFTKAETDMRFSSNARITLETAVFKSAAPQSDYNIDALLGRISALERKLEEGVKITVQRDMPTLERKQPAEYVPVKEKVSVTPETNEEPESARSENRKADILINDDFEENPFETPKPKESEFQPTLWKSGNAAAYKTNVTLGENEKKTVFAKFIKSLRTTRKNAIVFTLCMDLNHTFEGDKLILITDSAAVEKALARTENASYVAETLQELGVTSYEVRLREKGETEFDKALKTLRQNFDGTDIDIT